MKRFGIILMMSFCCFFYNGSIVFCCMGGQGCAEVLKLFRLVEIMHKVDFSKGEIVDVINTSNGKTITVVITGSTDLSGVLVLLSPSAAAAIGVESGYDTTVRISRKNDYVMEKTLTNVAPESKADPDTNSVAALPSEYSNVITAPKPETQIIDNVAANETTQETKKAVSAYDYSLLPPVPPTPKEEVATIQQNFYACPNCLNAKKDEQICESCKQKLEQGNFSSYQSQTPPADSMPFSELLITQYERGKFYVQLGVYRDMKNLKNIVTKYRGQYPISIKSSEKAVGGYEMLIGPLSQDEYRAILERFRKNGFKDAFVKFLK